MPHPFNVLTEKNGSASKLTVVVVVKLNRAGPINAVSDAPLRASEYPDTSSLVGVPGSANVDVSRLMPLTVPTTTVELAPL